MFFIRNKLLNSTFNAHRTCEILKRHSSKKHKNKVVSSCTKALKHFDDFYQDVFKKRWPSIRLGLLSKEKTVAVINNFGEIEKTKQLLESEGAFDLSSFLELQKTKYESLKQIDLSGKGRNQIHLEDVVEKRLKGEEEKESNLIYPDGKVIISKGKCVNKEDENKSEYEESGDKDYVYDIENTITSLHSDMSGADFDKSRLILPESAEAESSLYEFVPATKLRGVDNYIPESEYYKYYQVKSDMPINVEKEYDINFPEYLRVYSFDRGDVSLFPEPKKCLNDVYNFYEINGASLLSVLALDIQPGDRILNLCSTSGNEAYCIFQTLITKILVCNETKNIKKIFNRYLFDYSPSWKNLLLITSHNFEHSEDQDLFDKILVDVPCTNDKRSLFEVDDNPFSALNVKQRLQLPLFQTNLLTKALKMVRSGGTVVYTTNTLSPVQNEAVVSEALKVAWQEVKAEFTVKDLSPALAHTSMLFNFGDDIGLKYGTLVVPFAPSNFGPKYFCKIVKNQ